MSDFMLEVPSSNIACRLPRHMDICCFRRTFQKNIVMGVTTGQFVTSQQSSYFD
jgi:hypothetical protein